MVIKKGSKPRLSAELEEHVMKWIVHMAHIGYGQTWSDILDKVQRTWQEAQHANTLQ